MDIRQIKPQKLAVLVMPTRREPKYATAARQLVLEAMYETPVLFSAKLACLEEVVPHENVAKIHACMSFKVIMVIYPGYKFFITIAESGKTDVQWPKHRKIGEISNEPVKIIHNEDERFSYCSGAHADNNDSYLRTVY